MTTAQVDYILAMAHATEALEVARIAAQRFDPQLATITSNMGADALALLNEVRDGPRCIEAACKEAA